MMSSLMTNDVSNAIFQLKSTEYSVVFPLKKSPLPLKKLPLPTKYYPVLICNTYENLKLHEVAYLPVS